MRSLFCCTLKNNEGVSAIEFAIIAPVLLMIVTGVFQFGLAMNQYLNLTNAVAQGALTLALSRGTTTPYTATTAAIGSAAPNLAPANTTITVRIGGADRRPAGVREGDLSLQSDGDGCQLRAQRLHLERTDNADDSIVQ